LGRDDCHGDRRAGAAAATAVVLGAIAAWPAGTPAQSAPPLELFYEAASTDDRRARTAMDRLSKQWRDGYTAMIVDMARLLRPAPPPGSAAGADLAAAPDEDFNPDGGAEQGLRGGAGAEPLAAGPRVTRESLVRSRLIAFLEKQTRKRFDVYLTGWRQWMWTLPYEPHPDYAEFKGMVYGRIDPRMQRFFPRGAKSVIRLDEIDWGGVTVNGIPPLYYPKTLAAAEARYLRDNHVVFGVVVNGEPRAYPKRILAWHEMAVDRLGGTEITVVYCTLCGTVIPYDSVVGGELRRFGTSGLLYRSNKLMFDEGTGSLWSTLEGKPVVGTLADSGLEMTSHAAVTTTWGEWRAEHPGTSVLSLDTGHKRDYSEGAAYRDYFSHDRLYFQVGQRDTRLKNKTEMLVLRVRPAAGGEAQPVAIVASFLRKNPVFHFEAAGRRLVVVTSRSGANRVYALGGHEVVFQSALPDGTVVDASGGRWHLTEEALVREGPTAVRLPRFVAQRAFWFGWFAQFPATAVIGR
jgi:hypothetical protein